MAWLRRCRSSASPLRTAKPKSFWTSGGETARIPLEPLVAQDGVSDPLILGEGVNLFAEQPVERIHVVLDDDRDGVRMVVLDEISRQPGFADGDSFSRKVFNVEPGNVVGKDE